MGTDIFNLIIILRKYSGMTLKIGRNRSDCYTFTYSYLQTEKTEKNWKRDFIFFLFKQLLLSRKWSTLHPASQLVSINWITLVWIVMVSRIALVSLSGVHKHLRSSGNSKVERKCHVNDLIRRWKFHMEACSPFLLENQLLQ